MNDYQNFIRLRTYSRETSRGRRETWIETVDRYMANVIEPALNFTNLSQQEHADVFLKIRNAIRQMGVMPSMRMLHSAGKALTEENATGYNCAFTTPDPNLEFFFEVPYLLMCGCGVGYSVEEVFIKELPELPIAMEYLEGCIIDVEDTRSGWASAFQYFVTQLYEGKVYDIDVTKVRPKGTPLKTMGGRASGPEVFLKLCSNTLDVFARALRNGQQRLSSVDVFDICCFISEAVVAGGVRRSASIALTDFYDGLMRNAKSKENLIKNPQRFFCNVSAVYSGGETRDMIHAEVLGMLRSGTGERGIFNSSKVMARALSQGRKPSHFGTNPCGEVILRPRQFCNLTEVVCRPKDSLEDLMDKVEIATILGCIQSTYTNFPHLINEWKENCEEERLLGVSLTGIMDCPPDLWSGSGDALECLSEHAVETAVKWSGLLKINMPRAITCVKPSGTVSQLVNSSAGLHPRFSKYYIRRVIVSSTDPLGPFMVKSGVAYKRMDNGDYIFEFPMKSPDGAVVTSDLTAMKQLNIWHHFDTHWCEHNPSCTIYFKPDEADVLARFITDRIYDIGGITFFPKTDHIYYNAPFEEITKEEYEDRLGKQQKIDWDQFKAGNPEEYESACEGGVCALKQ